jgi:catechol 2,3-dioxygenase-like lactoylglutathione lyase family enzyme
MTRLPAIALALAVTLQHAPPRPAILGVAHVRLLSSDITKARAFYTGLLGFPEEPQANGMVAIFRVNDRQRIIARRAIRDADDRFVDVAFETPDRDAARAWLASHGLKAVASDEPGEGGGDAVETIDPDGHTIRLIALTSGGMRHDGPDRRLSTRILHAGLTIRDAAKADAFYKDVLGFSEIWRGGRTDEATSWINMRVPDGTDYLEYMLTTATPTRRELGTAHHIALLVPSIQDALEAVRARTSADDPNHRATPQIGRNRKWQLNLYDPDGTRIECMEPWTVR